MENTIKGSILLEMDYFQCLIPAQIVSGNRYYHLLSTLKCKYLCDSKHLFINIRPTFLKELIVKVRKHEEEIAQLRKHLTDYLVKVRKACHSNCIPFSRWLFYC